MKKVISASVGGRNFTFEEDAMMRLEEYMDHFRAKLSVSPAQEKEVMDEIEGRISELFLNEVGDGSRVVTLSIVEQVASTLGMPDGSAEFGSYTRSEPDAKVPKKLYRDCDERRIAGVCSGLAWYFEADVVLVRVIMLLALIFGTAGFWIYVVLWIAVPKADTPAARCEMRGVKATAENMRKYSPEKK